MANAEQIARETGLDPAKVQELSGKYGERGDGWDSVRTVIGPVVVRSPTGAEWDRFLADLMNDGRKHVATKLLIVSCVVEPQDFIERLDRKPGIQKFVAEVVTRLAGQVEDAEGKG